MITVNLTKMIPVIGEPVQYYLKLFDGTLKINDYIGKKIRITYLHKINCIKCGRLTKTSFAQGYCYPCFISAPETEECVLRPELCRAHEGIARDLEYAKEHCLIDHYVYLAKTGGLKVGVTRNTQIPGRWIDQGATEALCIAKTQNRYLAGTIEVALKNIFSDRTNWRDMLTNKNQESINLFDEKKKAFKYLHSDFHKYAYDDNSITEISYPVLSYPQKIKSINFDRLDAVNEILIGIKGQYLIFESGSVLNIRKHGGYLVKIEF